MLNARIRRSKRRLDGEKFTAINARFHEQAALIVEADAKRRVPVDQGRLRDSITHEANSKRGKTGTNVEYAPWVEYGTRPHFPPVAAIADWARRVIGDGSRSTAFLIARAISRRGTKAQPYLRPALDTNRRTIRNLYRTIFRRGFSG